MTSSNSKEMARRSIDGVLELASCFGTLKWASEQIGCTRNYQSTARSRGTMEHRRYYDALATFDANPTRLTSWSFCFRDLEVLEQFAAEGLSIALRREPPAVSDVRQAYLQGRLPSHDVGVIQGAMLDEVDALRYNDADQAASKAMAALKRAKGAAFAARALGSWASAVKVLGRLDDAHTALWTAMRIAAAEQQQLLLGDLVQRAVYVYSERGEFAPAVDFARVAFTIYSREGTPDLIGRALVDEGIALWKGGRTAEAEDVLSRSLAALDQTSGLHLCAAHQHLSMIRAKAGDLASSDRHSVLAQANAAGDRHSRARLPWMRGRNAAAAGAHAEAVEHYLQAADVVGNSTPVDAVLVGAELVRALAQCGGFDEARRIASSLRWAVIGLEEDAPFAAAALVDLVLASDEAEMFRQRSDRLAKRLEQAIVKAAGDRGLTRPQQPA